MGYTHYYYQAPELDAEQFKAAAEDCRKLCEQLPIPLGDGGGEGKPEFSAEAVCFNGHNRSEGFARCGEGLPWPAKGAEGVGNIADNTEAGEWHAGTLLGSRSVGEGGDGSYETFLVEQVSTAPIKDDKGLAFACCKTGFRPYDLNVQACLIVFKHHFGDAFEIYSDGDSEDWNEARDACQVLLGYGLDFELDTD